MFFNKFKDVLCDAAVDGIKGVLYSAKSQYPKIKSKAENIEEEAAPAVNKASDNVSKFVMNKYSEALDAKNKAERERKIGKMKTLRNAIIASSIGFTAGAATGYVIVKKSQIKESDYVFSDDKKDAKPKENAFKEQYDKVVNSGKPKVNKMMGTPAYESITSTYTISDDGKTIIKR